MNLSGPKEATADRSAMNCSIFVLGKNEIIILVFGLLSNTCALSSGDPNWGPQFEAKTGMANEEYSFCPFLPVWNKPYIVVQLSEELYD